MRIKNLPYIVIDLKKSNKHINLIKRMTEARKQENANNMQTTSINMEEQTIIATHSTQETTIIPPNNTLLPTYMKDTRDKKILEKENKRRQESSPTPEEMPAKKKAMKARKAHTPAETTIKNKFSPLENHPDTDNSEEEDEAENPNTKTTPETTKKVVATPIIIPNGTVDLKYFSIL